jgi:hypothetical protein
LAYIAGCIAKEPSIIIELINNLRKLKETNILLDAARLGENMIFMFTFYGI